MKKILTLVALVAMTIATASAQIQVNAGYVKSDIISSYTIGSNTLHDTLTRPGFTLGATYNYELSKGFSVAAGANIQYFNKKDTVNVLGLVGATSNFTQIDLVIPIYLNYTFNLRSCNLTLYAGPTINFGLVNKTEYHGNVLGLGDDTEVNWFDNEDSSTEDFYTERFRWGVTGGAQLSFIEFGLYAGYTMGMSDNFASAGKEGNCNHIFVGLSYKVK